MVCSVCNAALTLSEFFLCSRANVRFCMAHEPMDMLRRQRMADDERARRLWQPRQPERVTTRPARDETGRVLHG